MRIYFIVLVAATTILAPSSSTLTGEQAVDSVVSLNQAQSINNVEIVNEHKRSLRSHKKHDNVSDEERGFNYDKFVKMLSDETYRKKRFYNWRYVHKYSDTTIYDKLKVDDYPILRTLFYKYQKY
ncbi:Secreted RxLR effector peptide protein [Phytophthora palmivora]|uniref:RxLR effector protein n=1 Tax=Phytophthora palmivora TaxID=4796 RepID=A0A2P4XJD9_9STRA|nr:Secreted RxLR effector peptide protein [Phytophthora palmivora]